ncbi:MAG: hypothetical protein CMO41_04390 [Verrucomicrobiales bacterium]|nr:hypothetical protein [Verrucomicrobiales bacterium]|tara:strand:+ start:2445 stop:2798 length:354 start_codon:yes stop_codon:yes gene_type:complete
MSDVESLESDGAASDDSFCIAEVLEMVLDEDDSNARLCYLCRTTDDVEEIFDRSDLMDGGLQQQLVLRYEKLHPPPWDEVCSYCDGEGCEECECEECDNRMRHINGINYGCCKHPVI